MEKKIIEEEMNKNGYHISVIVGDSMMPMLRNRKDLVKIVPVKTKLEKYDLPLYRRPTGEYVLHRIVKARKKYCITCGDNRTYREKVPNEWIIGVMESFERDGRTIGCHDEKYMEYVRKCCRNYWLRKIKRKVKEIKNRKNKKV